VVSALSGPEALAILESGEAVDLLFTDIVMPEGMSGYALAEAAHHLRPGLKVLSPPATPPNCRSMAGNPCSTNPIIDASWRAPFGRCWTGRWRSLGTQPWVPTIADRDALPAMRKPI
jgi:hypothetical protein